MMRKLLSVHDMVTEKKYREEKRYLYEKINWDVSAICIYGARGTGKTTLMVQRYYEKYGTSDRALYISADHIFVVSYGLYEIADTYFKNGGEALFIDEIHKYPDWTVELKNIIDVYSEKKIVVSGSSTIELKKGAGDLSRRVVSYELQGFSFREFLNFGSGHSLNAFSLDEILRSHREISLKLKQRTAILRDFRNYLEYGYYPFFLEGKEEYLQRLENVVEKVVFEDLAASFNLSQPKLPVIKKLLWIIATAAPFTPNINRISKSLGISREYVYHYIEYLTRAGLIITARKAGDGFRSMRKPAKIFVHNSSLIRALSEKTYECNAGTMRESFFASQLTVVSEITIPKSGDFFVDGTYLFEVGGKNKTRRQIKGIENSFLAIDEIESGFKETVPLYLFGFLY
ncbi:MAG: AAA family ATPase [bacterium]